jgi:hypothetical protein
LEYLIAHNVRFLRQHVAGRTIPTDVNAYAPIAVSF